MKLNKLLFRSILSATCILAASCGINSDGSKTSSVDGNPVPKDSKIARSTVMVIHDSSLCSGTIIGQKTILTAAHCVSNLPAQSEVSVSFGLDLRDNVGDQFPNGRNGEKIINGTFHFENFIKQATPIYPSYVVHDWALIYLEREIPDGYAPVPLASDHELTSGMALISAGYGRTTISGPNTNTRLHAIVGKVFGQNSNAKEFEVTFGAIDRGLHSGDSGGPTYILLPSGDIVVAGVNARASVQKGRAIMTDVRSINARIKTLMATHEGT